MSGEKTEKPTPKKRQDLRKKGVVARSAELPQGVSLLALVVAVPMAASQLAHTFRADMTGLLSSAGDTDLRTTASLSRSMLMDGARAIATPVLVVLAASLLTSVLVTRERPSLHGLKPKTQGLNPKNGFKRLFGVQGLTDAVRAFLKLGMLIGVGYSSWRSGLSHLGANGGSVNQMMSGVGSAAIDLLTKVGAIALVVGLVDAWWARRRWGKQAKMSKNEVRDEAKNQEVSHHIKSAIRARQYALSRSRMIQAIQSADVVLANPTHIAVALSYAPGSAAPTVVARGAGAIALKIKAEAAKHEVPVIENRPLARAIYAGADVGDTIPVELFRAVAEVLAVIYAARRKRGLPIHKTPAQPPPKTRPPRAGARPRPPRRRKLALPRSLT